MKNKRRRFKSGDVVDVLRDGHFGLPCSGKYVVVTVPRNMNYLPTANILVYGSSDQKRDKGEIERLMPMEWLLPSQFETEMVRVDKMLTAARKAVKKCQK